ncbi:metallophosphoesterase family protein [Singulisphaera sp. PoT]|uniref:metallophosphoesterase family protein n=1 Tax=Singulisphaera sp. PoT TaxID=3411797 RepID=UPI003BF5E1A1
MKADDPIGVTFVVPGDLHLTEPGLENHRAALRMVGEVNELIRPDFVQFIGDNVQDATIEQFRLFEDLRGRLTVPHQILVGDHDVMPDNEAKGDHAYLGRTYGSTSLRGFRFIRLDTQEAKPVGLSPEQIDWFRDEVDEALAHDERIVIFQHNYPYQIWEDFAGPGIDDWRGIVQSRRIAAIFCGHTHYLQVANDGRNVLVATRSIGDPEGGPPGYLIGYVCGNDVAATYRSVQDEGPVVLVTHPSESLFARGPKQVVSGPDEFRVRVWAALRIVEVRGCLDGAGWIALEPSTTPGEWTAPLPGDRLAKGEHAFEVEATDADGRRGIQRITFMVDPTGRYTPVPRTHPSVAETAFC